jgi:hypothetical protein
MSDSDSDPQRQEHNPDLPPNSPPREHVREMQTHLQEMEGYLRRMGERLRRLDEQLRGSASRRVADVTISYRAAV